MGQAPLGINLMDGYTFRAIVSTRSRVSWGDPMVAGHGGPTDWDSGNYRVGRCGSKHRLHDRTNHSRSRRQPHTPELFRRDTSSATHRRHVREDIWAAPRR